MEQITKPEANESSLQGHLRPVAFLDSNVIAAYLRGDSIAVELFSAEAAGRIRFAVNPIVLQELLLTADLAEHPEFERIRDHLCVLPIDYSKARALLPVVRKLRNRVVHSNDILILSSADECDYLVTRDKDFIDIALKSKPTIVTPEEFAVQLRAA